MFELLKQSDRQRFETKIAMSHKHIISYAIIARAYIDMRSDEGKEDGPESSERYRLDTPVNNLNN